MNPNQQNVQNLHNKLKHLDSILVGIDNLRSGSLYWSNSQVDVHSLVDSVLSVDKDSKNSGDL